MMLLSCLVACSYYIIGAIYTDWIILAAFNAAFMMWPGHEHYFHHQVKVLVGVFAMPFAIENVIKTQRNAQDQDNQDDVIFLLLMCISFMAQANTVEMETINRIVNWNFNSQYLCYFNMNKLWYTALVPFAVQLMVMLYYKPLNRNYFPVEIIVLTGLFLVMTCTMAQTIAQNSDRRVYVVQDGVCLQNDQTWTMYNISEEPANPKRLVNLNTYRVQKGDVLEPYRTLDPKSSDLFGKIIIRGNDQHNHLLYWYFFVIIYVAIIIIVYVNGGTFGMFTTYKMKMVFSMMLYVLFSAAYEHAKQESLFTTWYKFQLIVCGVLLIVGLRVDEVVSLCPWMVVNMFTNFRRAETKPAQIKSRFSKENVLYALWQFFLFILPYIQEHYCQDERCNLLMSVLTQFIGG